MNDGPERPTARTYNLLYARSGNRCAFPGCGQTITVGKTLVGNVCHIRAASPGGPRYDPRQSNAERHAFENLMLLCSVHNKIIDDDEVAYTVERLQEMKFRHELKANTLDEASIRRGRRLLIAQDESTVTQAGNVHVHAPHAQNSVVAGVYQHVVHHHSYAASLPTTLLLRHRALSL